MRVLFVGANSYVGQHVIDRFKAEGVAITALARTDAIAGMLESKGIAPLRCAITEVAQATDGLRDFDCCVWLSFLPWDEERAILSPVISALGDTGKRLIFTSGTGVLGIPARQGEWSEDTFREDDPFTPPPWLATRVETERYVRQAAATGVGAMVIRPPQVWGNGGSRQVPFFFDSVQKTGHSCYLGMGLNLYSNVHVDDLAEVYWLAIAKGTPGALYHAVSGEENFRSMAEAVADVMQCSTRSISYEEGVEIWGEETTKIGLAVNSRSRSPRTRSELGWSPKRVDLIDDIRHGSYYARYAGLHVPAPRVP